MLELFSFFFLDKVVSNNCSNTHVKSDEDT